MAAAAKWVSGAAQQARSLRSEAGLDPQAVLDAGVRPTILRLQSQPPGATITVNGIGMGAVTPHDLQDLPAGTPLRVVLTLPGFRDTEEKVVLQPNQGIQEVLLSLIRKEGRLQVTSTPDGADISIGGRGTGRTTPAVIEKLRADETVVVAVRKKGYRAETKAVLITDDAQLSVNFDLEIDRKQIPNGQIAVRTSPSGCEVAIDDQVRGSSPVASVSLRPGLHVVSVRCENYAPQTKTVEIVPSKLRNLSFVLKPTVFGYLTLTPQPVNGSVVRINGRRVNLPIEFLKLVPGRHVVEISNADLNKKREVVINVAPNARVRRVVNLLQ
ncbi:MAG: PEGA domain-containing protein [Myxococcota bacterium]